MRRFAVWLAGLIVLTAVGVVWLRMTHSNPETELSAAVILIGYSPLLAAIIAVALTGGIAGLAGYGRQFLRWRVGIGWYVGVIAAPLALVFFAVLVGDTGASRLSVDLAGLGAATGSMLAGSLGEEPGWRGVAHPSLRGRLGFLPASLPIVMVAHFGHNLAIAALEPTSLAAQAIISAGYVLVALVVVVLRGRKARAAPSVTAMRTHR